MADGKCPLRPKFHARTHTHTHTHTEKREMHTHTHPQQMLTSNPYKMMIIIITLIIHNNGSFLVLFACFLAAMASSVHWPIKITRRENRISCPIRHQQLCLKNSKALTCTNCYPMLWHLCKYVAVAA